MTDEQEVVNILRGVLEVQQRLTAQLQALWSSHCGLVDALAANAPEATAEDLDRVRAELSELERLFDLPSPEEE